MIKGKELKLVQEIVQNFFQQMLLECSAKVKGSSPGTINIEIEVEEAPILIGINGETLLSIQSLLKKILTKRLDRLIFVDFDINGYKKTKSKQLKDSAATTADQVALTGVKEVLPSMFSWERRIVHLALIERKDVYTESEGQGKERRVIIKPTS
jgi:spoIIIJ-associated protein